MTTALKAQPFEIRDAKEGLQNFLMLRQKFFQDNPHYANIFFNAVLQPPKHLLQELTELRSGFDEYSSQCYLAVLDCLTLRNGITKGMALEYFFEIYMNPPRQTRSRPTTISVMDLLTINR